MFGYIFIQDNKQNVNIFVFSAEIQNMIFYDVQNRYDEHTR